MHFEIYGFFAYESFRMKDIFLFYLCRISSCCGNFLSYNGS